MQNIDWLGAFLVGLLGAGHCIGMCGGIASAIALNGKHNKFQVSLLYNLGRISSYLIMGAVIGGAIASGVQLFGFNYGLFVLRVIAALFILALGFYLTGWWNGLLYVEKLGQRVWKLISPCASKLMPLRSRWYAFPLGFIWGWIPCGMVYSMISWAAISGGAVNGVLIMGAFGLGTLPAMLTISNGATNITSALRKPSSRRVFGIIMIVYGLYSVTSIFHI
ncbi:sulfite exporter TauE/SafE family protein [Vibrio gallicus]|uniref:sulfite exporter TauE/SafE family protein n=1 Tax=Vibrio gallicus TaxID=190897 RepID=UPI0021C4A75F|nr:sulfite exporter TauE/SafE family protein [Vibrio gallicus]